MRVIGLLCTTLVVACLNVTPSYGQGGEQHRSEEQSEPYHKHHDTRHGHDHFYPDRGAIVRDLPKGTIGISYASVSYRYHDGIWLEARGPAYMVVAPPIGLVAPTLPLFSTIVTHGGETYLYANDTYYRPRPDLGGYEVVNDPVEEPSQAAPEALVGGQLPGAPVAMQTPATATAAASPIIAAALPVPVSSAPAAVPAVAQTAVAPIASQAVSFTPPPPVSMTGAAPSTASATSTPATSAASTAGPAATAGLAATAGSAAVPVAFPAGSTSPGTQKGPKVFLYPKNGQSSDQQAHDRYDCYRFAVAQSGFDPMRAGGAPAPASEMQSDYERAQSACFEARGYTSR
jgi:hypothetical protein